jgi:hypothetical protein
MKRLIMLLLLFSTFVFSWEYIGPGIHIKNYTGTGATLDTIPLAFQPVFVYVKRVTTTGTPQGAAWKTPSMDTTLSMSMYNLNQYGNSMRLIADGDSGGVEVTSAAVVNESGSVYVIMAFSSDVANYGSYAGDDVDVREIPTGQPVYHVGIKRSGAGNSYWYSGYAYSPTAVAGPSGSSVDRIENITGNSFYVDDHADVNASGSTYYWWTIVDTAFITEKTYVGNGVDDRDIALSNLNVFPYLVTTNYLDGAGVAWMRWVTLGADLSTYWLGVADGYFGNNIQDHSKGSVQMGTGTYTNQNGSNYVLTTFGVDTTLIGGTVVVIGEPPDPCAGKSTKVNKGKQQWTKRY